jgi:hypothetical protein
MFPVGSTQRRKNSRRREKKLIWGELKIDYPIRVQLKALGTATISTVWKASAYKLFIIFV